jgi:hypothetical protein
LLGTNINWKRISERLFFLSEQLFRYISWGEQLAFRRNDDTNMLSWFFIVLVH